VIQIGLTKEEFDFVVESVQENLSSGINNTNFSFQNKIDLLQRLNANDSDLMFKIMYGNEWRNKKFSI
jgi:hypothetical protein